MTRKPLSASNDNDEQFCWVRFYSKNFPKYGRSGSKHQMNIFKLLPPNQVSFLLKLEVTLW